MVDSEDLTLPVIKVLTRTLGEAGRVESSRLKISWTISACFVVHMNCTFVGRRLEVDLEKDFRYGSAADMPVPPVIRRTGKVSSQWEVLPKARDLLRMCIGR